jgi:hypothetical protein
VVAAAAVALIAGMVISDPNGSSVTSLALFSILDAWVAAIGVRGWRSATLVATAQKVTVRQLVLTTSWSWGQIDGFTTETRPVPWAWLPWIRSRRRVLGVRLRDGRVRWLDELACRPSAGARSWVDDAAVRLNELVQLQARTPGV